MRCLWAKRLEPKHFPADRLTVGVFGPGRGEAVFVWLPDGRAGVLDGCSDTEDPVADLVYRLDQDRGDKWRFAFMGLTHPHDDHFGGLGGLLERYQKRIDQWWECPLGERHLGDFLTLLELQTPSGRLRTKPADLKSLQQVLYWMGQAARNEGRNFLCPQHNLPLFSTRLGDGSLLSVSAVGPVQADIRLSAEHLARAAEDRSEGRKPRFDPNYTSAAILLRWGQAGVLLGGDLLGGEEGHLGWEVARDANAFDQGPVQVVKSAHHASAGAHDDELWRRLKPELTLVTPFRRAMTDANGAAYPPRPKQVEALRRSGSQVVITARPQWRPSPDAPRPRGEGRSGLAPPVPEGPGARNEVLDLVPATGRADLNNAVAVTLDVHGNIEQVVLAGDADFYDLADNGAAAGPASS